MKSGTVCFPDLFEYDLFFLRDPDMEKTYGEEGKEKGVPRNRDPVRERVPETVGRPGIAGEHKGCPLVL
jgi:hypothetical protein